MTWSFRAWRLAEASNAEEVAHCSLLFAGHPVPGGGGGGGPASTLTPWTVVNNTAGTLTNVPIEIWLPFSDAAGSYPFVSTDAVQLVDTNGSTILGVAEDNRSSDIQASPNIRGVRVTAIAPSLAVGANQFTLKRVPTTSPTTGTDVSVSDVVAVCSTIPLSMGFKDGNTYTADLITALQAGAWSANTAAANMGTWLTGSGLSTQWIVYCPFKNGATPTTNNIGVYAAITAFKAQRGAVSGPNPIIGIRVEYWIECGWLQTTIGTQENHWFDLSMTCGSNSQNWVGSSPAQTLTLSGTSGDITCTAASPIFTADSVGNVIMDAAGNPAVIQYYTNSTTVTAYAGVTPMSGTSLTSGNWRIFGLNMKFATKIPKQEIWFGGSPAITAQPNITSHLGAAWNAGAGTGGPFTYWRDCGMVLPYTTAPAAINNDMTRLNQCGANPTGTAGTPGPPSNIGVYLGDVFAQPEATGGRDDIAPIPGWFVGGMIKADTNGRNRIFGNALKWGLMSCFFRDQTTGKPYLFNGGTDWCIDHTWGTQLPQCGGSYTSGPNSLTKVAMQDAHHPGIPLVPWLYTGDYYWVEMNHQVLFWTWTANNPGYWGSGLNRLFCCSSELRGNGWNFRDLMQSILMIPDRNPSVLSYSRSHLQTIYTNQFTATGSGTPNVSPYPGINLGCVSNTGAGKTYATAGFRSMGQSNGSGGIEAQWQLGYMAFAFFLGQAQGMLDSNCAAFMTWFMEGLTGAATSADVQPNWMAPAYWATTAVNGVGAGINSWLDVYRWTCNDITEFGANLRLIPGAGITLSGLSGSGITVTMPAGYFTNGGNNFYGSGNGATQGGGFIQDLNAASWQKIPMDPSSYYPFTDASLAITSITQSGGVATATTTNPHGFATGKVINLAIYGATPAAYNAAYLSPVACTITGASTFTYTVPGGTTSPATGSITYQYATDQEWQSAASTSSASSPLPTNNGSVRLYNTGSGNVWAKLSVGAGTATNSDTLVAPGTSVVFTVGSNTYINYIGASNYQNLTCVGSIGNGYAVNDTLSVTCGNDNTSFSITTRAILTVDAVGPNGDVNKVSISTPGLYITSGGTNTAPFSGTFASQFANVVGSGTGWSYNVWAYDSSGGHGPLKQGRAIITGVSGNTLTLDTNAQCDRPGRTEYCYPFAQVGLVSNKIRAPGPAAGDLPGTAGLTTALPQPQTGSVEYWTIAANCAVMADRFGYANGAAAKAFFTTNYTGSSEVKWKVN